MTTTQTADEKGTAGYVTIEDALARTESADEKRKMREERRANAVTSRRSKAYAALVRLPAMQGLAHDITCPKIAPDDLEDAVLCARRECRRLATTDEHCGAARLALDALGALWAVL